MSDRELKDKLRAALQAEYACRPDTANSGQAAPEKVGVSRAFAGPDMWFCREEDETRLRQTVRLARQEAAARVHREKRGAPAPERIPCLLILRQFTPACFRLWAMQAAAVWAGSWGLTSGLGDDWWRNESYLAKVLCLLSVLVFMSALPMALRSAKCRMQELEATAVCSGAGLIAARILLMAWGDMVFLGAIFLTASVKTELAAGNILLYLLLPSLLAASVCLWLSEKLPEENLLAGCWASGAALVVFLAAAGRLWKNFFCQMSAYGWTAACLLLFICLVQLRQLMRRKAFWEPQPM